MQALGTEVQQAEVFLENPVVLMQISCCSKISVTLNGALTQTGIPGKFQQRLNQIEVRDSFPC